MATTLNRQDSARRWRYDEPRTTIVFVKGQVRCRHCNVDARQRLCHRHQGVRLSIHLINQVIVDALFDAQCPVSGAADITL